MGTSDGAAAVEICNLLYRYAETMDEGRFEDLASELYADCRFVIGPLGSPTVDGAKMVEIICQTTIRYPDGTPHTKHVITNPIVEVGPDGDTATCRSNYVVYQQTESLPFQAIVAGRYRDKFALIGGRWCFAERDYTLVDMVGDIRQHVRLTLTPATD